MRNTLIELRKQMGFTQKQMADEFGITRAFYGHIETGKRNPTINLAKCIAEFFNKSIEDIFFNKQGNKLYPKKHESSAAE